MEDWLGLLRNPVVVGALQSLGLLLARLLPLVAFTPVFGGQAIPARLRFGITVVRAAGFLPVLYAPGIATWPLGHYVLLLVKEVLVGFTLAVAVLVLFATFTACGALLDLWRGASIALVLDPASQQQESVLGVFLTQTAIALFLTLGFHRVLLLALGDSFAVIHPHQFVPARLVGPESSAAMIGLVADSFSVAVRLSTPVLIVALLLDLGLGLINRMQRQIQVFFVGLEIKGTAGILLIFLTLALLLSWSRSEFVRTLRWLQQFVAG